MIALPLPDLGVTLEYDPATDTATADLGWFGKKPITSADIDAIVAWVKQVEALRPGKAAQ